MARNRESELARHARYNASRKGRTRNLRYEDRHPERRTVRWARQAGGRIVPDMAPPPAEPMRGTDEQ